MEKISIAIVGGGPAALFLFKRFVDAGRADVHVHIFEATGHLGSGMPYSELGSNVEHLTNVSGNEIPNLVTSIEQWFMSLPDETIARYNLSKSGYSDYKVLPRLLFGEYLSAQFDLLRSKATSNGLSHTIHLSARITNITADLVTKKFNVEASGQRWQFDQVVIATGHYWPMIKENKIPGYFDSPYPPAKLERAFNHPVAIRGSSLTAFDAVRTIARQHGRFVRDSKNHLSFMPGENIGDFKIVMHSRHGLLPAVRFHLDDPHLSKNSLLSKEDIVAHMKSNDGFLSLDFIFEKDFKEPLKNKDRKLYDLISDKSLEEFVGMMMGMREIIDPFELFKREYDEAETSIGKKKSVYWKEMLAILSFAMNYPAKHFSAEDMLRLQKVLMPLISIVIAFVPQSSVEEVIALHDAGLLELISVGDDGEVDIAQDGQIVFRYADESGGLKEITYRSFVDAIGQRHLNASDLPFPGLLDSGTVTGARLRFRSPDMAKAIQGGNELVTQQNHDQFYLDVPGIAITDDFRVIDTNGKDNPRLHFMAVSFIGGFNPDYSGLDFCEEASGIIVKDIFCEIDRLKGVDRGAPAVQA